MMDDMNRPDEPPVLGFNGEFSFLSNFYPCDFVLHDIQWKTAEHAFQAMKLEDHIKRVEFAKLPTPRDAKRVGKLVPLRDNWLQIRFSVMYDVVYAKFSQNERLADKLLNTNERLLQETNTWHDTTWGVCKGKGTNWLGEILMSVRTKLRLQRLNERY
jgi:ribA/ribD-fused uncharacterized protein